MIICAFITFVLCKLLVTLCIPFKNDCFCLFWAHIIYTLDQLLPLQRSTMSMKILWHPTHLVTMRQNINLQLLDRRCQIAVIITRSFIRSCRVIFFFWFALLCCCLCMSLILVTALIRQIQSGNPSTHTTWQGLLFQKNPKKKFRVI